MNEYSDFLDAQQLLRKEEYTRKLAAQQDQLASQKAEREQLRALLEKEAKPEFDLAREALTARGIEATIFLGESSEDHGATTLIMLSLRTRFSHLDYNVELRAYSASQPIKATARLNQETRTFGTVRNDGDIRDFARQTLREFLKRIPSE